MNFITVIICICILMSAIIIFRLFYLFRATVIVLLWAVLPKGELFIIHICEFKVINFIIYDFSIWVYHSVRCIKHWTYYSRGCSMMILIFSIRLLVNFLRCIMYTSLCLRKSFWEEALSFHLRSTWINYDISKLKHGRTFLSISFGI